MMHGEEIDVTTRLAQVRDGLVTAIAADQMRSRRRRRRARLASAAVGALLAIVGTAVAASTGLFSPAPDNVKGAFSDITATGGPSVDASKAVRIGTIDDHAAFAAPTAGGGFCLHFAANPRSGPTGNQCTSQDPGPGEIVLAPQVGTDGGFVLGRVGSEAAATIRVQISNGGGTLTARVAEEGFFLAVLPERAIHALQVPRFYDDKLGRWVEGAFDQSRIDAISATALDARRAVVARSTAELTQSLGEPTETGSEPVEPPPGGTVTE
jgi:hypothetical protein